MADLVPVWKEARGAYQDAGRDNVPAGFVWDLIDYIPEIIGAPVRQRGKWGYQSDALTNAIDALLYANYKAGPKLLAANSTNLADITLSGTPGHSSAGTIPATKQNPVFHRDRVIVPAANGTSQAKYVTWNGTSYTLTDAPASAIPGKYATVFKDRLILGGSVAKPTSVAFSKPGDPTVAWDTLSIIASSSDLTGIAAQRNQILCFHSGSVERIRGTTPPDSTASDPTGDMTLDTLFDLAGCYDARSIASWNDNVIFSDPRGVHITDGAIVRNMAAQGGILAKWRRDFFEDTARGAIVSVAGGVLRDLYITTIRSTSGAAVTWVCDIPTRRWYRFSNVDSNAFAVSVGIGEKLFAVDASTKKVTSLSDAFNPDPTVVQTDANAVDVKPVIETGWLRIGKREGWKRLVELFLSYETVESPDSGSNMLTIDILQTPNDATYTALGGFRMSADYIRRKLPLRGRFMGIAFRITQARASKDTRLYDVSVRAFPEEETRI